ncbi:hypothetical protein LCGC14_2209980 [marine sediment metagenome]|uniref:Uncharacterized protein n=1 Tax=marine sediment metagenome TaxID=412755 RepID=A0A0F9G9T2_9ZZZZ
MENAIRRSVLIQNHFNAIRLITNKAWPSMPLEMKSHASVDDLFNDCIVELRKKLYKYDARRGRPVTFIYLVLRSYLNRQRDFYARQKRHVNLVRLDDAEELMARKIFNVNTDEAERLFLEVYATLNIRLQGEVREWFFLRSERFCRKAAKQQTFVVFRRIAKQHGLTEQHCLTVMADEGVQIRLKRKLCTLIRRYE